MLIINYNMTSSPNVIGQDVQNSFCKWTLSCISTSTLTDVFSSVSKATLPEGHVLR